MDRLRILVVDDHDDFRRGLRALLDATESLEVVGVATNGATAVSVALDLQPDVIVDGPAHARAQRHRGHREDRAFLAPHRRPCRDDDGGRGVGLLGGAGGCEGLSAQRRAPAGDRPFHRGRGGRGGHLRPRHRRAHDVLLQGLHNPAAPTSSLSSPTRAHHPRPASPTATRTTRSHDKLRSPPRPCATMPATSSRSCRLRTGHRRSSWPGRRDWVDRHPTRSTQPHPSSIRASSRRRCPAAGVVVDVHDIGAALVARATEDRTRGHLRDPERGDRCPKR